ncbi:amidohydrolase family protein [Falsiroseomonas stagni]|uniref:Predicted metal-dependent hydrolase, TIM-barrel fold n=1 Tax=Falsiroseomonas stagni DSM 19981 TaxID=1123062 RepID=A0A1I4AVR6_9PROT|nr:amidohydrolase family protein [Falsiroseomonas stagni]SFK60648.1 Predicted metal-dependent hydrolase, TIM-barrel fold [Falsiroseomonas stagni DSM 19981]
MTQPASDTPVRHPAVRPDWLARHREAALEPGLPIIDPHHHLWGEARGRYLLDDFLVDAASGHDIRASVFIECDTAYRTTGEARFQPVGETEFVVEMAERAAALGGPRVAAGIVGFAELTEGASIRDVLEAQIAAGRGRFRGVRHIAAWHPDAAARGSLATPPPMLMLQPRFREGFAQLAPLGLSFDAWMYHTQIAELRDLADAFPETPIVLNHVGGAIGIGPYATRRRHVMAAWGAALRELAHCQNVHLKIGGLGMRLFGFAMHEREAPPDSATLAEAWRPLVETCVEAFGATRCMFESNFPVDKAGFAYGTAWNAFKRITASWSAWERAALFHDNAARFYRIAS